MIFTMKKPITIKKNKNNLLKRNGEITPMSSKTFISTIPKIISIHPNINHSQQHPMPTKPAPARRDILPKSNTISQPVIMKIHSRQVIQIDNKIFDNFTTIRNVYQLDYDNSEKAAGMGDFIRGSYFIVQACNLLNKSCIIDVTNHPISQFIQKQEHSEEEYNNSIRVYHDTNFKPVINTDRTISYTPSDKCWKSFVEYLKQGTIHNGILSGYVMSFPMFPISAQDRDKVRQAFHPSTDIENCIQKILIDLNYVSGQYTIIHIRLGDTYLVSGRSDISNTILVKIFKELDKIIQKNNKYILVSDTFLLNPIVTQKYPSVKSYNTQEQPVHLGLGINGTSANITAGVKQTMTDFYIMSQSTEIISLSTYVHGSGFSKWCAETFNIKYTCKWL